MTKTEKRDEHLTLERQRVVNALISAAQLRLGEEPDDFTVRTFHTVRYVQADRVVEDVVVALGVTEENARMALTSAVSQGLLEVPVSLPVSEHPVTFIRPGTL